MGQDSVVYDDVPERTLDPRSARLLVALGALVCVCGTVVLLVYVLTHQSGSGRNIAKAAALTWVAERCPGISCVVGDPHADGSGVYTVPIRGDVNRCILVDVPAFQRSGTRVNGVFPTACNNLGLRHSWLTVAVADSATSLVPANLNDPTGFEADLLDLVADRLDADGAHWIHVKPNALTESGPKPFDLLAGKVIVTSRVGNLVPSRLYMTLSRAIVARSRQLAHSLRSDPSKMQSLVVGAIGHPDRLPQHAVLRTFASRKPAELALAEGTIDALLVDQTDVSRTLHDHPAFGLAGVIRSARGVGFALPKNSPLTGELNVILNQISSDGEVLHLFLKWFPQLRHVTVFPSAPPGQTP